MNIRLIRSSVLLFASAILLVFSMSYSSEFFQAPVPDEGELLSTKKAITVKLHYGKLSLKETSDFYKSEFKDKSDIKWGKTKDFSGIVIYDWGNRKWHKIKAIDMGTGEGTLVTIKKDSWTWIIGVLIIRFAGVFIVLIVLMIALYISGSIFILGTAKKKES